MKLGTGIDQAVFHLGWRHYCVCRLPLFMQYARQLGYQPYETGGEYCL